jgi:hypothetical protein
VQALLAEAVTAGFRAAVESLPGYRALPGRNLLTVAEAIGAPQPLSRDP